MQFARGRAIIEVEEMPTKCNYPPLLPVDKVRCGTKNIMFVAYFAVAVTILCIHLSFLPIIIL